MMKIRKKREGAKEKKNSIRLDSRFILLAFVGAILLAVLIFIQTRFSAYMRMDNNGLAVYPGTVTDSLGKDPDDEEIEKEADLFSFDAMDYIYARNDGLFFGEKEKTRIDAEYPVYLNHGASVQMVNDKGVLLDKNFEETSTYKGLILDEGLAYNTDGEQADAAEYIFIKLNNGNFVNLKTITYTQKGKEKDIAKNSLVHFEADYFAYYEVSGDKLVYKSYGSLPDDFKLKIGDEEYSYQDFLKKLGVIKDDDKKSSTDDSVTEDTEDETEEIEETPAGEVLQESNPTVKVEEKPDKDKDSTSDENRKPSKGGKDGRQDMGVRPDEMRPDKKPGGDNGDTKKPEIGYVKPEVTLGDWTASVYRITAPLTVTDPAKRIDKNKQIQFEVYEVDKNGKETLRFRSYRTTGGTVEIGGGNIAPATTYRIKSYFTYNDEYNVSQVEQIGDATVTTKGLDTLGSITLNQQPGTPYNNRIEIAGLSYADGSDLEAVYGIDRSAGITITVQPLYHTGTGTTLKLNTAQISKFKAKASQDVTTMSVLSAKTTYQYEITAQDYFGNTLTLLNNTGTATTSNHAPEARLDVKTNEIDNMELSLSMFDVDGAAVAREGSTTDCDVYVVVSTSRKDLASAADLTGENVVWSHKLDASEYTFSESQGISVGDLTLPSISGLELDTKYFATVYCDYDLSNGKGAQRFQNVGQLSFTSAGLSSLGKVYITCEVSDITCESAFVKFKLNTTSTNPELSKLITRLNINVMSGDGDDKQTDASVGFDKDTTATNADTGDTYKVYEQFRAGNMMGFPANGLSSMTDYSLEPHVYAEYNGKEYELIAAMTSPDFKTLRKPATVTVENLLFAAGSLVFDTRVDDPDEAISGYSGDKVVVNLYTADGEFVKAVRIEKNKDLTVTFENLDVNKKYQIRFVAVEYNEGYTNATFESNKVIHTVDVDEAMRLSGTLKLQDIVAVSGDNVHYTANAKATLEDPDHYLTGENALPYYIRVEKEGKELDTNVYQLQAESADGHYENTYPFQVDRGEYTYKLTLYVIVSGRELELDTLQFTSETTVKGFCNAYEMIRYIKDNPYGKFVATNDIVLSSKNENYQNDKDYTTDEDNTGATLSGTNITNIFHGTVDFQGFTLEHHHYGNSHQIFNNIGPGAVFENVVYNFYSETTGAYWETGGICYRNFGTIRNIYATYKGAKSFQSNQRFALLARSNAATGIIEYFVVKNEPEEDRSGFTALNWSALVAVDNFGTIRYGYVYGDDIEMTNVSQNYGRYVGGIASQNVQIGKIYSVYSMVNMIQEDRSSEGESKKGVTWSTWYGAVTGINNGTVRNTYSIGESTPAEDKSGATNPVTAGGGRTKNVYYWNENNKSYSNTSVKLMTVENLYDMSWQDRLMGDGFDTTMVQIGYYPHVNLSADLPEQEYIPLPERTRLGDVEISGTEVLDYFELEDGTQAAHVKFIFSNKEGLNITGLDMEDLTVELDTRNASTEDGYTTMTGVVSAPKSYKSSYNITTIHYIKNSRTMDYTLNPAYQLSIDFFRPVYTADDWYDYVVTKAKAKSCENVRLMNDIDFADVDVSRIMVTYDFTAKLDGNGKTLSNINLQKGFKSANNNVRYDLFSKITGNAEVYNLNLLDYKCGGTYTDRKGKQYVAANGAFCYVVEGQVYDVHIQGIENVSYGTMGGIAAIVQNAGEVKDCSVTASDSMGVTFTYQEPQNVNSDISLGGIAGNVTNGRITHCFVTDAVITADAMKGSNGVGAVVGYASNSVIDTAYAEGSITTRATKVGGIVGQYYATNASIACVKNVWAKVDIICSTDMIGELIGQANITNDLISSTNNMTGLGVGNVYASNPDIENISHTVGNNIAKPISFYGTQMQLINGASGDGITESEANVVRGLLTYEKLTADAGNTYRNTIGFENVYSMDGTADGYMPKMYYDETRKLLPCQKDIKLDDTDDYNIEVSNVYVNTTTRIITVELKNPDYYKITGLNIDDLKWHYTSDTSGSSPNVKASIDDASDYTLGTTRIYLQYEDSSLQEHYLDSYVLRNIQFYTVKNSNEMTAEAAKQQADNGNGDIMDLACYARIPATLYRDIDSLSDWNKIPDYPEYENYRLTSDIDFGTGDFAKNLKISRLVGMGKKTMSNVNISGTNVNLISRLNSGLQNIILKDSTLTSSGSDCIGFIGISNGTISDCEFDNLTVIPKSQGLGYVGIIGYQNGNSFRNLTLNQITIKGQTAKNINYVGAITGYVRDVCKVNDIKADNLDVAGNSYVGGLYGLIVKGDIDSVELTDITVQADSSYVGGMAALIGNSDNANQGKVKNITLTGTPELDENGVMTGSTTSITGKDTWVGGVAGCIRETIGTGSAAANDGVTVTGCYVSGRGSVVGGIFGSEQSAWGYHLSISDSLVRGETPPRKGSFYGIGGAIGDKAWNASISWADANNVRVESTAHYDVGGLIGYVSGGTIRYSTCTNGVVKAEADTTGNYANTDKLVGGFIGDGSNASYSYCGTINTIVDAETMSEVGGFAGRIGAGVGQNNSMYYCYSIGKPDENLKDTIYAAQAAPEYYVKGKTKVGGLVGTVYSQLVRSYSNMNVDAGAGDSTNDTAIAGGLAGYYANHYVISIVGVTPRYNYSYARLQYNYFAGSVNSTGYAGGAIGRIGLLDHGQGNGNNSRTKDGKDGEGKTGYGYERDYTSNNIVIASTIDGKDGITKPFAADDREFTGRNNRLWDGTLINGTSVSQLRLSNGAYDYPTYWEATEKFPQADLKAADSSNTALDGKNPLKLQLFKAKHLKNSADTSDTENWYVDANGNRTSRPIAAMFYRNMGWSCNYSATAPDNVARNYNWRVSMSKVKDPYESTGENTGDYLPQLRSPNASNQWVVAYDSDSVIAKQSEVGRLPIPTYDDPGRTTGYSLDEETEDTEDTYGIIYASDVDAVNLEFSYDLVGNGYYELKYGDAVTVREKITERVVTYQYDFKEKLTLTYGFFKNAEMEEENLFIDENLDTLETITRAKGDLVRNIMVYGDDYYYISKDGLVSSTGTYSGDYVMLMNGKALDSNGNIISAADHSTAGSVANMTKEETAESLAQAAFMGYTIDTYAKCSKIAGSQSVMYQNDQIFIVNGQMYVVDGGMENQKDGILLYTLNGTEYMTILGNDGVMVDMIQEDVNIPEEVSNKAILQITNTLQASVPYAIVEYGNGGMIGYNYATGEILFDNHIDSSTSLLDYAKEFFTGDKDSMYHGMNATYAANADLSKRIHSSADLDRIVGNNSGELITDHSTGENTGIADADHTAKADGETAAANPDNQGQTAGGSGTGSDAAAGEGSTAGADAAANTEDNAKTGVAETEGTADLNGTKDTNGTSKTNGSIDTNGTAGGEGDEDTKEAGMLHSDTVAANSGKFMTVYNPLTGMYEIVSVDSYLTDPDYISENARLGISDLSSTSGYAAAKTDHSQEHGIVIYLIAAGMVLILIGGVIVYTKKKRQI